MLSMGIVGAIYSCLEIIENYPKKINLALSNTSAWWLLAFNFASPIVVSLLLLLITNLDPSLVFGIGLSLPFSIRSERYNHGTNKSVIETDLLENVSSEDVKNLLSKIKNVYLAIQINFYEGIDLYLENEKSKLIDIIIKKKMILRF